MHENTPVWVAERGSSSGTGIVGVILHGNSDVILETKYCL